MDRLLIGFLWRTLHPMVCLFAGLMPYKFVPFFCNVLLRPAIGPANKQGMAGRVDAF